MPVHLNITRAEAAERSRVVRALGYDVALDLTTGTDTFLSTTTLTFSGTPGAATWVDLVASSVREISLNGDALDPAEVFDGSRIRLPSVAADNTLVVVAECPYMRTGEGLHRFVDPVDGAVYLYSQFETADSRRMYAVFEQPDQKAPFRLSVTAPADWQVRSNAATPEPVPVRDGVARWDFDPTPTLSTYVTALVAGPYHVHRDEYVGPHGTYPLGVFCRASLAQYLDVDDIVEVTKQGFAFFEEAFGTPYPFGKYDQLFVPEFNAGAMENAACVTILEDYVFRSRVTDAAYEQRANTVLHELAHMWFGDLVTMRWWDDLWLNESFAEWASHHASVVATRYVDAWTTFLNQRKNWAYRQDQLPTTHPIAADMVDLDAVLVNFDGITYAKGAAALRQLVAWVGEEQFFEGLRAYFAAHAWGNTELTDLLRELEKSSGRQLAGWAEEWLQTPGVNLLRPVVEVSEDGTYSRVAVAQEPPSMPPGIAPTLRSHRIALGLYDDEDGVLVRRDRVELDVVGPVTEVPQLTGARRPALLVVNDDDLTYAKIRLDDHSWRTAVSSVGRIGSALARALVWFAAWDMTRDAEVPTGEFVELVLAGLPGETDIGVVQQLLRQAKTAIDVYAAPENREAYQVRMADATERLMRAAEPGSDRQLAFARGFTSAASTDGHLDLVAGLLSGDVVLEGLDIDTDLRWTLLQRLVATGRANAAGIDAELARDDTATGRRQAAYARAALPTAEAKAEAWTAVVERTDLPNAILAATVGGWYQPDQVELLRPFRDTYFAALPGIWDTRTPDTAQTLTVGLYPALLVEPGTLTATDAFLAGDVPTGARRLVREGRDGIERALRARARDGGQ